MNSLSDGTYSDCAITVSDTAANESNSLTLTSFTIDSTAATLVETTSIDSSTNDSTPITHLYLLKQEQLHTVVPVHQAPLQQSLEQTLSL